MKKNVKVILIISLLMVVIAVFGSVKYYKSSNKIDMIDTIENSTYLSATTCTNSKKSTNVTGSVTKRFCLKYNSRSKKYEYTSSVTYNNAVTCKKGYTKTIKASTNICPSISDSLTDGLICYKDYVYTCSNSATTTTTMASSTTCVSDSISTSVTGTVTKKICIKYSATENKYYYTTDSNGNYVTYDTAVTCASGYTKTRDSVKTICPTTKIDGTVCYQNVTFSCTKDSTTTTTKATTTKATITTTKATTTTTTTTKASNASQYTATFYNGSTKVATKSCSGTTSCTVSLPTAPTKSGYTFNGWGNSSSCTSGITSSIILTADKTYYACWKADNISPSDGCYVCGTTYKYYKASSVMASNCSTTVSNIYTSSSQTNGTTCSLDQFKEDHYFNSSSSVEVEVSTVTVGQNKINVYYAYDTSVFEKDSTEYNNFKKFGSISINNLINNVDSNFLNLASEKDGFEIAFIGSPSTMDSSHRSSSTEYGYAGINYKAGYYIVISYTNGDLNNVYHLNTLLHEFAHSIDFFTASISRNLSGVEPNDYWNYSHYSGTQIQQNSSNTALTDLFVKNSNCQSSTNSSGYCDWGTIDSLEQASLRKLFNDYSNKDSSQPYFSNYSSDDLEKSYHEYFASTFKLYYVSTTSQNLLKQGASNPSITYQSISNLKTYLENLKKSSISIVGGSTSDVSLIYTKMYATGTQYQGNTIECGDNVFIASCGSTYCEVKTINGKSVSTTTMIKKSNIVSSQPSCTVSGCTSDAVTTNGTGEYTKKICIYKNLTSGSMSFMTDSSGKSVNYYNAVTCASGYTMSYEIGATVCPSSTSSYCHQTVKFTCKKSTASSTNNDNKNYSTQMLNEDNNDSNVIINNCQSSAAIDDATSENLVTICYNYQNDILTEKDDVNLNNVVNCKNGYTRKYNLVFDSCKAMTSDGVCSREYLFTCSSNIKPVVKINSVSGNNVTFTVSSESNAKIESYLINNGEIPSIGSSNWQNYNSNNKTVSLKSSGTYYIWAKDSDNNISEGVSFTINSSIQNNTLSSLKVVSEQPEVTEVYKLKSTFTKNKNIEDKNLEYVRLANEMSSASGLDFDPYETEYEVVVDSPRITVYATLTSDDASYVPGYEPRTVDLEYGENIILIKVVNKSSEIRTYAIIANRVDNRSNNNFIEDIDLSSGSINNFNPYVSDYTVNVSKNVSKVTINATLDSYYASFVEGYGPREIELVGDVTSAVLKVVSEAGNVRNYVITFDKTEGSEPVDNKLSSSVNLSSLSIPGTQLQFDKYTTSYTVSVEYNIEDLPVYAFAESGNAAVEINGNFGLKVGTNLVEVVVKNGKNTKTYTIYVNRKEAGIEITDNTMLATLTVQGYDINFNPSVEDYVIKVDKEKTLLITATAASNNSEVYITGNNDLTGFSTVRVKVIAETGDTRIYSLDIRKDAYDEENEKKIAIILVGVFAVCAIMFGGYNFIIKRKSYREN